MTTDLTIDSASRTEDEGCSIAICNLCKAVKIK